MPLSSEELLAGASLTQEVDLPAEFLPANGKKQLDGRVILRPLTVRDLQQIGKASREDDVLSATLMIQQALVDPSLDAAQVAEMPAGLARFLVDRINRISGIDIPRDALQEMVQAPLAKACFVLSKEFGWTPEEVSGMTIGQILLYVEMASRDEDPR